MVTCGNVIFWNIYRLQTFRCRCLPHSVFKAQGYLWVYPSSRCYGCDLIQKALWWDFPWGGFLCLFSLDGGLFIRTYLLPLLPHRARAGLVWAGLGEEYRTPLLHPADAAPRPWPGKQVHEGQAQPPALSKNFSFCAFHWFTHVITAGSLCLCKKEKTPLPLAGGAPAGHKAEDSVQPGVDPLARVLGPLGRRQPLCSDVSTSVFKN